MPWWVTVVVMSRVQKAALPLSTHQALLLLFLTLPMLRNLRFWSHPLPCDRWKRQGPVEFGDQSQAAVAPGWQPWSPSYGHTQILH